MGKRWAPNVQGSDWLEEQLPRLGFTDWGELGMGEQRIIGRGLSTFRAPPA